MNEILKINEVILSKITDANSFEIYKVGKFLIKVGRLFASAALVDPDAYDVRIHVLHPDALQDGVHTVFNEGKLPAGEDHAGVRSVKMEFCSVIFPIL